MTIVVAGGGIAGLTAAFRLQQLGIDYRLVETLPAPGGVIRTEVLDGFVIEGGPDSFLAEKPWARELCEELGLGAELIPTNPEVRKIYIVSRGALRPLPAGLIRLIPTDPLALMRSGIVSLRGCLRAACEPFVSRRPGGGDEAIGSFVRRRFGGEVHLRLIDALLSGIYAGDSDALSLASTFPRLQELEQSGSVLLALRRAGRSSVTSPAFLSLRQGMGQLVRALVAALDPARILCGRRLLGVRGGQALRLSLDDGSFLDADGAVLALPSWAAAEVVAPLGGNLSSLLRRIPHVSTATVTLAYPATAFRRALDGFGFIVPRIEKGRLTACTWTTTKLPHRAPEGIVLLRCFIGRAGEEEWVDQTDEDLVAAIREELASLMGVRAAPLLTRVFRWIRRMPQYLVGHQDLLHSIDEALRPHPNLALIGSSYRGVGIPDCIRDAGRAVTELTEKARSDHGAIVGS